MRFTACPQAFMAVPLLREHDVLHTSSRMSAFGGYGGS